MSATIRFFLVVPRANYDENFPKLALHRNATTSFTKFHPKENELNNHSAYSTMKNANTFSEWDKYREPLVPLQRGKLYEEWTFNSNFDLWLEQKTYTPFQRYCIRRSGGATCESVG